MKAFFLSSVLIFIIFQNPVHAQIPNQVYVKATDLTFAGEILPTKNPYHRVDTGSYVGLPSIVKHLLTQSAGKVICFSTNSKQISAKWCVSKSKTLSNLTGIANKGLDLYIKKEGKWQFAGVGKPGEICNEGILAANMDNSLKECLVYLPLYDEVSNVEIGVEKGASLKAISSPFKKRVLIYGSSIVQGASASRPGMAYPARLSRLTGYDFLNLGLSGSAKMEPEVVAMVNKIDADAYLLDCIPNSSEQMIIDRTEKMILSIQQNHPGKPIILLNSINREAGFMDSKIGNRVIAQNKAVDSIANVLLKRKTKDFYFINVQDFLGSDHEGSTDGVHPNDLGSYRFVEKLTPLLNTILKKYF